GDGKLDVGIERSGQVYRRVLADYGKRTAKYEFGRVDDACKYLLLGVGDYVRRSFGLRPLSMQLAAAGLGPGVAAAGANPVECGLELRAAERAYCVIDTGSAVAFSHVMPMSYEELDDHLTRDIR